MGVSSNASHLTPSGAREKPALRALIVEDDESDALLLLREVRKHYDVTFVRVQTREAMREALEGADWDLVLSDFSMPQFGAPEALALVQELEKDIPFIIVSGTIGEETAVESMRAGARDFLTKDKLTRLVPAIGRELYEAELRRAVLAARQRAEADRERLLYELRAAVQARDTFLVIASHELRTPLTSLQLTVQSLERAYHRGSAGSGSSLTNGALGASVDIMVRQTARLGVLVENLLDVTRITSKALTLSREQVDLAEVASLAVAQSSVLARHAQSELVLDTIPTVGTWDRFRIETVVSNLLSNAIKFGAGSPVRVKVTNNGDVAELSITDSGPGISPEDQARIFEKFERAVTERHYGGFGLGLWITRQIVQAHGGTIRVESEAGKGSTFRVELPIREAHLAETGT